MNNDLISRSELRKAVNDFYDNHFKGLVPNELITYAEAVDNFIDNAPTVEERPQGEWGPCYENYRNGMFYRDCSICGKATITGDWKFCPYCGAEMKGGTE